MGPSGRRGLAVAAAFIVLAALPAPGDVTGVVVGITEDPLVKSILQCRALENEALNLASTGDQKQPLSEETAIGIVDRLTDAIDILAELEGQIGSVVHKSGYDYGPSAKRTVKTARTQDTKALEAAQSGKPAGTVADAIRKANELKLTALLAISGLAVAKKELARAAALPIPEGSVFRNGDFKGMKKDLKVTPADRAAGTGDSQSARGDVRAPREPKPYKYLTVTSAPAAVAAPKNLFYAFEGTSADPGYLFKSFSRELFGPFQTRFQVGAFDRDYFGDTGSACIEFDLAGSSPLVFLAVCGRRTAGGVQVFAQSDQGAVGNVFLAGALTADVVVDYSGTSFSIKAKPHDFPDGFFQTVGTHDLVQGETALVAGMGGSGLTKGAPVGLDDIYIIAQ